MALQITYESPFGGTLPNAYLRINRYNGDKIQIKFDITIFADASAKYSGKRHLAQQLYAIPYTNQTLADLYAHLKSLDEFAGALDV